MKEKIEEIEATPVEDLMREHGLLNRLLLIYEELLLRLYKNQPVLLEHIVESADIVKIS